MSTIELKPIPFIQGSMKYGGTPEENIANYMKTQNSLQSNMNNKYGGSKSHKNRRHRINRMTGGRSTIEVPQFPINNSLNNSSQNPNTASLLLNKLYINGLNNSKFDCYATNSCSSPTLKGGFKKSKRYNKIKKNNKKYKTRKSYKKYKYSKYKSLKHKSSKLNKRKYKNNKNNKNTKKIKIIGGGCDCGNDILLSGGGNKKCKCMNWLKIWKK